MAAATPPAGYPSAWQTDVALADGSTVQLRPVRPDDGERIVAFHARQSPQSIYYRYFSPRPALTARDVERLTQVDYVDRMAFVAVRDDVLVGVARYDRWQHRAEAEVAFFIDDAHGGRGIATALLEHLAARAREVGVAAFTATVLPDNRRMTSVFTAAGFATSSRFADGVIEVRLDLQPTPEAEAAIESRARHAAAAAVERLLSPRSVAVIGASRQPGGIGHQLLRHLLDSGFTGSVWPVHPEADSIAGAPAARSLADIGEEIDLAVVAVPAAAVPDVVEDCGRQGVREVVVMSAGFAEQDAGGAATEAEVLRRVRRFGMRLLGPATLGLINSDPSVRLHATFVDLDPLEGRFALLSESGMVGAAIVEQAHELGVGISSFVALGNRADVSGNDLLQYWEADERTAVVGMYIESFGNPRRFARIARSLARVKPIVAAHAGLGAGDAVDVLLEQTGVIRVRSLTQLLDVARLLVHQPLPAGERVAVVGNAGGSLAIAADACIGAGLLLAADPVDLGLTAEAAHFERAVGEALAAPSTDAVLAVYSPALGGSASEIGAALLAAAAGRPDVPLVACFFGRHSRYLLTDETRAVPVYRGVEAAADALGRAAAYARWRAAPPGTPHELDDAQVAAARQVVSQALDGGSPRTRVPLELEARERLLAAVRIGSVAARLVDGVDEAVAAGASLGWPLALKAASRDRLAKTVAGGLALDLGDEAALRRAWAAMSERLHGTVAPALVQAMVEPGVDVAVALSAHPLVGQVMTLRSGGAAGALDPDEVVRVLPITDLGAARLVASSHLSTALDEASRRQLEGVLAALSALAETVPEVVEVVLDPVIVRPDAAVVIDTAIAVAERDRDPLPPVRRL